jgi:hypothetical protein
MKTTLLTLLVCLVFGNAFAQTSSLNGFDDKGKKHGRWIMYMNYHGGKEKDSTKAVYKRYTTYQHGRDLYPLITLSEIKGRVETTGAKPTPGKPVLLDGEYIGYDKKGRMGIAHTFNKGEYVSNQVYYSSGKMRDQVNFAKPCAGQDNSATVYYFDETGKMIKEDCAKRAVNGRLVMLNKNGVIRFAKS